MTGDRKTLDEGVLVVIRLSYSRLVGLYTMLQFLFLIRHEPYTVS